MRILHVGDDFAALRPCGLTLYSDALMQGQAAAGHEVGYVFSGRVYPWLERPRLKRWRDRGVAMYELVGSPNAAHWEAGTREPLRDLGEPAGEAAFAAALRELRPEVVHVHELARLPSSVLALADVPVVMTLHDYRPLCASVRLLDADGRRCTRREVGEECARNCAGAPAGRGHLVEWTVGYELRRAKQAVPLARHLDLAFFRKTAELMAGGGSGSGAGGTKGAAPSAPAADYQRRRDVNVARLAGCDRLVAPSARSAALYAGLGVPAERIVVQRLTLPHIERMRPRRLDRPPAPVTFATLNGASSAAKGLDLLVDALRGLPAGGFRLRVFGRAPESLGADPRVSLEGSYAPEELDRRLDDVDVGIVPSIWEESHGFVGPELLAKGIPVIGSALGGIPEYVRDGETGWLNRSATGEELARHMADAIAHPEKVLVRHRSVLARRRELVRSMADHLAEVEALYDELVGPAAPSPPGPRWGRGSGS